MRSSRSYFAAFAIVMGSLFFPIENARATSHCDLLLQNAQECWSAAVFNYTAAEAALGAGNPTMYLFWQQQGDQMQNLGNDYANAFLTCVPEP